MSNKERLPKERVNFFDGQKITETDLDTEQIYNRSVSSEIVSDFHGAGVIDLRPFEDRVLLNTRSPSYNNPSKLDLEGGSFDGLGISLDMQPGDSERGNRLVVELKDVDIKGRQRPKVLIIGRTFNGTDSAGILNHEFIEFESNCEKVTKYYYQSVAAIFFNNFSGGAGKTENEASAVSLDLISHKNGYALVKEAEPLSVFSKPIISEQILSPSYDMANFITSSPSNSIGDEIEAVLDSSSSLSELYYDLESQEQIRFEKNGSSTIQFGQKFLSTSNNLQRIDLLLAVEEDSSLPNGEEFDWSGDLVIGIHEISNSVKCPTDAIPDDLIEFDPDLDPIIEISLGQDDFESLGYKLNNESQIVSFNFASTLIGNPNIEPSLEKNKFYALLISRRGDNTKGTLLLEKGYDNVSRKQDLGIELSIEEQFTKQQSRFFEYDTVKERFVDDPNSSLWFRVYSNTIEVLAGSAYATTGKSITLPKTQEFVGGNEISYFEDSIPLSTVANGENNYVVIENIDKFKSSATHPLTGNFVYTRIEDAAGIKVINASDLANLTEDEYPLILARVKDLNVKDASNITGLLDKPGQIYPDKVRILNPSSSLLSQNLVGRVLTPDTDCDCTARYKVAKTECFKAYAGDLNSDSSLSIDDIGLQLDLVGNTINSSTTEKRILSGELDILEFIKSDLNNDGTIDGIDIQLLEDAIDGYLNFSISEEISVLDIYLENLDKADDFPILFQDGSSTGSTSGGTNQLTFTASSEEIALAIRNGDQVEIEASLSDSGVYLVSTKNIAADGITVTLEVRETSGGSVSFNGTSGFNITIISGSRTNAYADNNNLLSVPFEPKNFSISYIDSPFSDQFVDVCDLRRFVDFTFVEEVIVDNNSCEEEGCIEQDLCSPSYKNQRYFDGDLYIPNGNILKEPGIPHPGDYEFVNVIMPIPPGTISDCSINLYETFVKLSDSCKTAAGYPAMKFSDGTFVGESDDGAETDLSRNRVKFSSAIASLHVDGLVDGYAVDGYADEEIVENNDDIIDEQFVDHSYNTFSTWTDDPGNDVVVGTITKNVGANNPAIFDLTTIAAAGDRYLRINSPAAAQGFQDDFIVDFTATRVSWPVGAFALTSGTIRSFGTFEISNTDGSSATLKLGWKNNSGESAKLFYSGIIRDTLSNVIETFEHEIDAPDSVGDEVLFRLRRTNDACFAYFIIPGQIGDSTSNYGEYIRIGDNPANQPGNGTVDFSFELEQSNSPNAGDNFITYLNDVVIRSEFAATNSSTSISIGRVDATNTINRLTTNFPLSLSSRTNIISATLSLSVESNGTILDSYNVIPLDIVDADNIDINYNIPETQNSSYITSFVPGTLISGGTLDIDITPAILGFLANQGHLPGFFKGFVIEPAATADSSFTISSDVTLTVTYEDISTGVIFKVGVSIDPLTGIATLNTKNILYDSLVEENRTVINFGVHLKKSGFANQDLIVSVSDLQRIGVGSCVDETDLQEDECFFVVGTAGTGTFVEGPIPCNLILP